MFGSPFSKTRKTLYVRRKNTELEPQDVLLDRLAQEEQEERFNEKRMEVQLSSKVSKCLHACFLILAAVFLFQTFYLQVFGFVDMQELAQKNTLRILSRTPNRGVIYDQDMVQLVRNHPSFDFVCDKRDVPESREGKEGLLRELALVFHKPFEELKKDFDSTPSPEILIKEHVSHEELVLAETRRAEFQGCYIDETIVREYIEGKNFFHVLGYAAKTSSEELRILKEYSVVDQIGKMGIEKAYEDRLRGIPAKTTVERDSFGVAIGEPWQIPGVPGQNIVLWLKSELQKQLVFSLGKVFGDTGAKKGAALALDPRTGGVLAMVSLPSFDTNVFSQGISVKAWETVLKDPEDPLFNRAMSGIGFPTGSVIKPLVALGALEEGIIQENTSMFAPFEICVWNKYLKQDECFRDWKFHGQSDVKRAIAESVNTFFYIIGGGYENYRGLGAEKIKEYIEMFGWGKRTGIDIPGEGMGILPVLDKHWRLGDTYHLSIGQGPFAITPLQVAAAFVPIANKGTLFQPQVVQKFLDSERNVVEVVESKVVEQDLVSKEHLEVIREGMRQTVTAGSATGFLDRLSVKVAAKTGTAQTGRKTWDGKDYLYSWTVAFAPYENPEIVLVVVVEDVREGQVAALPVVRDVLQWYFAK